MKPKVNETLNRLFSMEGKTILITGAAGGIFSEVAKGMAAGGSAYSVGIDLLSMASIKDCVEAVIRKSGKIDVLVNGAGINKRVPAIEWAKYGIRSNALAPGHIRTPLTEPLWTHPTRC